VKSIIEVLENRNSQQQQQQHLVNTPQNVGPNENYMVEPTKTRIKYVDSRTTPRTGELVTKLLTTI
jgi:hypothetical protein